MQPLNTPPHQRRKRARDILTRVNKVDLHDGRCLIENCARIRGVQYCHYLPRHLARDKKLIDSLKRSWNIPPSQSLNLDTRYNICCLGASIHTMFDKRFWLLVPDANTIEVYVAPLDGLGTELYEGKDNEESVQSYSYQLVPIDIGNMRSVALHRQEPIRDVPEEHDFKTYIFPFHNFPVLTSHLHPRFVIAEGARRLCALPKAHLEKFDDPLREIFDKMIYLWGKWTEDAGPTSEEKGYEGDDEGEEEAKEEEDENEGVDEGEGEDEDEGAREDEDEDEGEDGEDDDDGRPVLIQVKRKKTPSRPSPAKRRRLQ